jgi:uncharacterized membrane protein
MAISVTEILGTDSLSGSRLVINDNFTLLASEINAMENYFNPTTGTITNLNDVKTEALRVGLSTILLDVNSSTFDILTNVNATGNINLNGGGLFRNDVDPQTLDDTFAGPSLTVNVGTSTAIPPYTIERIGNNATGDLDVLLNDGAIGQEIFFVYSEAYTGSVNIRGAVNPLVLPGAGATPTLTLDEKGQSVHLLCIDDGTGNGDWYLVGGVGYTIS